MDIDRDWLISAIASGFIYVFAPFWFLVAPLLSWRFRFIPYRSLGKGILVATLVMWPLMLANRIFIEVPYIMTRTDDPLYDGVGGNAALLVIGWLVALIFQLPHMLLRLIGAAVFGEGKPESGSVGGTAEEEDPDLKVK